MKNWWLELITGRRLAEVKIQRGIFQGNALSLLLFVIAIMTLNHILRKCTGSYNLTKLQEKIIKDIKMFAKNEKELETLIQAVRIYSLDVGMEFSIENCVMLIMRSWKQHKTEGIEIPNQEKLRMLREEEIYKRRWKKKILRVSQENEKTTFE